MDTKENILETFKRVSIRGRMAFAINCFGIATEEMTIWDNSVFNLVYNRLCEFTNSTTLDTWDEKINDVTPAVIMDNHPDNTFSEYKTLSEAEYIELKSLYTSLDKYLIDLISSIIGLGTANFYGGTGKWSEHSFLHVRDIIKIIEGNNLLMPNVADFVKYSFNEENGWGNCFEYTSLRR